MFQIQFLSVSVSVESFSERISLDEHDLSCRVVARVRQSASGDYREKRQAG